MAKRVLLGITYGTLGIALTVALTLSAFELAGRNLSNTAGSADVRLVGEDVRPPRAPGQKDRSHHPKHENRPGDQPATTAPSPTVSQPTSGTSTGGGPASQTGGSGDAGAPGSGSGGDHEHEHDDD